MRVRRSAKAIVFVALGYVIAILVAWFLFAVAKQRPDGVPATIFWTWVVVAVLLGIIARCLVSWGRMEEQEAQDTEATDLLCDLRQRKHRRFILYLRSFRHDFAMPQRDSSYSVAPISPSHWIHHESERFEEQLSDVGEDNGLSLVSLGDRYLAVGAARLETTDQDWFDLFRLLAGTARLIFLIPATSRGSLEEIIWLQHSDLLAKTIFIQPPAGLNEEGIKTSWEETRRVVSERGLTLPDFDSSGQTILIGQPDSNPRILSLRNNTRKTLAVAIEEALRIPEMILWPPDYPYETERDALKVLLAARWRCHKCGEGNAGSQQECLFCRAPRPKPAKSSVAIP